MKMKSVDELRRDYEDAKEFKCQARHALKIAYEREHPSPLYRLTHSPESGKSSLFGWYIGIVAAVFVIAIIMNTVSPNFFYKVGDTNYQLNCEDLFTCPHDGLQTTTAEMITYDGYYYYCPMCGHVMGKLVPSAEHF